MSTRTSGTPFVGYLSLTNGAPGPLAIPIYTLTKGSTTAYTLATGAVPAGVNPERMYLTNIEVSSNDTANPLFQLDDGAASPRVLAKVYASTTVPSAIAIPPGITMGAFGIAVRGGCAAITLNKTVEVVIRGYVSQV